MKLVRCLCVFSMAPLCMGSVTQQKATWLESLVDLALRASLVRNLANVTKSFLTLSATLDSTPDGKTAVPYSPSSAWLLSLGSDRREQVAYLKDRQTSCQKVGEQLDNTLIANLRQQTYVQRHDFAAFLKKMPLPQRMKKNPLTLFDMNNLQQRKAFAQIRGTLHFFRSFDSFGGSKLLFRDKDGTPPQKVGLSLIRALLSYIQSHPLGQWCITIVGAEFLNPLQFAEIKTLTTHGVPVHVGGKDGVYGDSWVSPMAELTYFRDDCLPKARLKKALEVHDDLELRLAQIPPQGHPEKVR